MGLKDRFTGGVGWDADTGSMQTTPWVYRTQDGVYVGSNGQVWLYKKLPTTPLEWENNTVKLRVGGPLETMLVELGSTSRRPLGDIEQLAVNREVHLLTVSWLDVPQPPKGISAQLSEYLQEVFWFWSPVKTFYIGVKLRSTLDVDLKENVLQKLKDLAARATDASKPNLQPFETDRQKIEAILTRHGATTLKPRDLAALESWYNKGSGTDARLIAETDRLVIPDQGESIEFAAAINFNAPILHAPEDTWISDATTHRQGATVVSIRGELQTAEVTRKKARSAQRKAMSQIEEQEKTGDLAYDEDDDRLRLAKMAEDHFAGSGQAALVNCSVIMGRRGVDADETYMDRLRTSFDIEFKPLAYRQIEALDECLPCSSKRLGQKKTFAQDMTIPMIAYSGISNFAGLGDDKGIFLGLADPDLVPVFVDIEAAPIQNLPPAMAIVGDPGSGKAQPLHSKVLTPSGWKPMGEMNVGDQVIGSDGQPHRVKGVFPQGVRPVYRITFNDGSTAEADADHYWVVTQDSARKTKRNWQWMTTNDLVNRLLEHEKWYIPMVQPVQFAEQPTPATHPYVKGLELTETGNRIPAQYLTTSILEREQLLQGILDIQGAVTSEGSITLPSNDQLTEDVKQLVASLGGQTFLNKQPNNTLTLQIVVPEQIQPFTNSTKAQAHIYSTLERSFAEIEFVGHQETQCISVDVDDQIYVTDDYICTKNTFASQLFAYQAVLDGHSVIMVNPKSDDTLAPFCNLVGGRRVSLTDLTSGTGTLDPFRYAPSPQIAAEIAQNHILNVIELEFERALDLQSALIRGANNGARCVWDALQEIDDKKILTLVSKQIEASPLFALGVAVEPVEGMGVGQGLTLIEFDRPLNLPDPATPRESYTPDEKLSLAALRLVIRSGLEILLKNKGGVFLVDEAWTFLGSEDGKKMMQRLSREGRSQRILPIFATQRLHDVMSAELSSYLSRVLVMKMSDPVEATAALELAGIEPSPGRLQWLADAHAKRPTPDNPHGRPALGIHRDLAGRHAAIQITPVPKWLVQAISTNPLDREKKENVVDSVPWVRNNE